MDDIAGTPSGIQYRADYRDSRTFTPMEPVYDDLHRAQRRCEELCAPYAKTGNS